MSGGVMINGRWVKALREQSFITRAELAQAAGLSYGHLARIEVSPWCEVLIPNARNLARALGVPP
jgi:transcriptional regulator with XRE-family HTH domain